MFFHPRLPPIRCQLNPAGASAFVPYLAGFGCERMFGTRRFGVSWSWTVGAQWLSGSWKAGLAWSPGKLRLGLRQVPGSSQTSQEAKPGPESGNNRGEKHHLRKRLLKWKINSENKRLQNEMGSHRKGKGSETKGEMSLQPYATTAFVFFSFLRYQCGF